jgi:hypothetical protein
MKQSEILKSVFVLLLLLAVGVISRFGLIDMPNFKPIAAIVLFAAFWFRSYWVAGLSLVLVMLVSNSALDHCPWQVTLGVIGGLSVAVLLGRRLRSRFENAEALSQRPIAAMSQLFGSALVMSIAFFVISNFSVWAMGQWYPLTLEGLVQCYTAAIPFFKYTFCGDLLFSFGIFACWCFAKGFSSSHECLAAE